MAVTKLANLINPQVMADIISAKITNAIVVFNKELNAEKVCSSIPSG